MFLNSRTLISAAAASIAAGAGATYLYHDSNKQQQFSIPLLDPRDPSFGRSRIVSNERLTADTHRIRIAVNGKQSLPSDSVFHFYMAEPTSNAFRPFTPVDWHLDNDKASSDKSYIDVLVKRYPYPLGDVARYLCSLTAGDELKLHGPHSTFDLKRLDAVDKVGMIAGGTGISTMLQLVKLLRDRCDALQKPMPKISLLYGSRTADDILLEDELEPLTGVVDVVYFVDSGEPGDRYKTGYIDAQAIQTHFPAAKSNEKFLIFVCGNPAMMATLSGVKLNDYDQGPLLGTLRSLGYTSNQVYKF